MKTVLVTGASRGIGKAIAKRFAENGYAVIINSRKSVAQLEETRAELEAIGAASGSKVASFAGDIGDYKFCEELFKNIEDEFGKVDILVNNAGVANIGLFQDVTPELWDTMVRTNLTSVYNCSHLAVPGMISKKEGKIINISSVWGVCGASCEVVYSATKGGINSFTMALAKELAPSNIQVNAIACGAINTEMNSLLSDEDKQALCDEIPAGRMGEPEEVAELVYHLASGENYLTGQVIKLDGGWI